MGGTEHYNSKTKHTADVFDIVCCISDTLASTAEFITREQLFAKLYENLLLEDDREYAPSMQLLEFPGNETPATNANKLLEFLEMDEDERGCRITFVEGHVTWLVDFKDAYSAAMNQPYESDPAVFARFGYVASEKRLNCCTACKQIASKGCCEKFSHDERRPKEVIFNMRLVRLGGDI
jgi:hypothetical protein